jgi:uncharacterized protein YraI
MSNHGLFAVLAGTVLLAFSASGADIATVKKDRVNVRGKPGLVGEVVTQLSQGETVTLLDEITLQNPKKGEPAQWARIQLPPDCRVWVFAPYIDEAAKTVNVRRVNLRGGPGENYSILGRIERGTEVREIRSVSNWMEIEAPTNAFAYVALDLLEKVAPAAPVPTATPPTESPTVAEQTPPAEPSPTIETVETEPPPAAPVDTAPPSETTLEQPATAQTEAEPTEMVEVQPEATPVTPSATFPQAEPPATPEPQARRIVMREGRVVYSRSIQAPTTFALESQETHRLINYLHTEQVGLKLKSFAGRKVLVTGEELLDSRWANIPILEVEDIRITP